MAESGYFQRALADFAFNAACGDSIRHLADLGYTPQEIQKQLAFSVPLERIEGVVQEYLRQKEQPQAEYIKEYDSFGRPSFRRVERK